ncbi:hypothetical protein NE237_003656 [Protea cynaroides]|uniref:Uncharacterized protein n=1 Tax=Protea cynaroides TaxID=273540 RepID=A0A9Q0QSU3_9MAGN|nr:hypothetical protein NE237_003656 [Protea cynaroides]
MAYPSALLTQILKRTPCSLSLSLAFSVSHVYTALTTANNYFSQETQDSKEGQEMKEGPSNEDTLFQSSPRYRERKRAEMGLKRPRNTKASSVTNQPTQLLFYINMPSNNRM